MESLLHIDPTTLIKTVGLLGVWGIIFAESGLFFGFFLPGDSLLFASGLLAAQGLVNFPLLLIGAIVAAIVGDSVGYWTGARAGPQIFIKDDSILFNRKHIARTHAFYAKHGPSVIVLARFVPVVRTFTPILAGVGRMPYALFLRYNILGGILWCTLMVGGGYFLGRVWPQSEKYLTYIIIVIVLVSLLPVVYEWIKESKR